MAARQSHPPRSWSGFSRTAARMWSTTFDRRWPVARSLCWIVIIFRPWLTREPCTSTLRKSGRATTAFAPPPDLLLLLHLPAAQGWQRARQRGRAQPLRAFRLSRACRHDLCSDGLPVPQAHRCDSNSPDRAGAYLAGSGGAARPHCPHGLPRSPGGHSLMQVILVRHGETKYNAQGREGRQTCRRTS